jgi:hypothetical protein
VWYGMRLRRVSASVVTRRIMTPCTVDTAKTVHRHDLFQAVDSFE